MAGLLIHHVHSYIHFNLLLRVSPLPILGFDGRACFLVGPLTRCVTSCCWVFAPLSLPSHLISSHLLEHNTTMLVASHLIFTTPTGNKALYGSLDPTTLEWTDGIFTKVLREVSGTCS